MIKYSLLLISVLFLLNSCKMAEMVVDDELVVSSKFYEVTKKNKFFGKTLVVFGDYTAQETKRSFPWSTNTSWFYNKHTAKHRFQFNSLNRKTNNSFQVVAVNSLNVVSTDFVSELLPSINEMVLNVDDNFAGKIKGKDNEEIWNFYISNISLASPEYASGFISNGKRSIYIEEAEEITRGWVPSNSEHGTVYGFFFIENGKKIGAVRVFGDGKIWFDVGNSEENNDLLAAMSSAFIMMKELD